MQSEMSNSAAFALKRVDVRGQLKSRYGQLGCQGFIILDKEPGP